MLPTAQRHRARRERSITTLSAELSSAGRPDVFRLVIRMRLQRVLALQMLQRLRLLLFVLLLTPQQEHANRGCGDKDDHSEQHGWLWCQAMAGTALHCGRMLT